MASTWFLWKAGTWSLGAPETYNTSWSEGIVCMGINSPSSKKTKHISFHGTLNVAGILCSSKRNYTWVALPLGGITGISETHFTDGWPDTYGMGGTLNKSAGRYVPRLRHFSDDHINSNTICRRRAERMRQLRKDFFPYTVFKPFLRKTRVVCFPLCNRWKYTPP